MTRCRNQPKAATPEEVLALVKTRYTAKRYDPARKIEKEKIDALMEVLRLAPSSINIQPWHFYLLETPEALEKLKPAIKSFNVDRLEHAQAVVVIAIEKNLDDNYLDRLFAQEKADGRFESAADIEALCKMRQGSLELYCGRADKGERWADEQAHIALGFVAYAAAAMGVDTTILGGLWFDKIDEIFGLGKEGRKSVAGFALGVRAEDDPNATRPKSRFPAEEVVTRL